MSHDERNKETIGKPKLHLVPTQIIRDIAIIREYGNKKYPEGGQNNWKAVDPRLYYDAAFRHLLAEIDKPGSVDTESGLPHLSHLACNIAFLCEMKGEIDNGRHEPIPIQYGTDRLDQNSRRDSGNEGFRLDWTTTDSGCPEHR